MSTKIFLFLLFISICAKATTLNEALLHLNKKHLEIGTLKINKHFAGKGQSKIYNTIGFEFKNSKYELSIITPTTINEFVSNKNNLSSIIFKSYEDQPTPYLGIITNIVKCPKKFTPETLKLKIANKELTVVKALAGKNFNFGICENKQVAYSACTSFFHDEQKLQYYKLKVFSPVSVDCFKITSSFFENLTAK